MISRMRRAATLAAFVLAPCGLLAGCGDAGFSLFGGPHWRLVENEDRLTGQTQSHAELTAHLDGGGQATLRAVCAGEPGGDPGLRISGEISTIGPAHPLDQVSEWRAAAGSQEGDVAVTTTGQDGFVISVATASTATAAPSDMNAALLSSRQAVRAEVAREGENPILNFRNSDDAFQAMVRRCRLRADQTSAAAPAPAPASPEDGAAQVATPTGVPAAPRPASQGIYVPPGPTGGPAPLPPSQRAPLPPVRSSNKP
jgi:hypothetical protein